MTGKSYYRWRSDVGWVDTFDGDVGRQAIVHDHVHYGDGQIYSKHVVDHEA